MAVNNNGPRNPSLVTPMGVSTQAPTKPTATTRAAGRRNQGRQKSVDFADKSNLKLFAKGMAMDGSRDVIKTSTKPSGPANISPKSQVGCVVHVPDSLQEPVSVTWQSGQVYKGDVNAKAEPHGHGFLIQDDGSKLASTWVNGRCTSVGDGKPVPASVQNYVDRAGNPGRVAKRILAQAEAEVPAPAQAPTAERAAEKKSAEADGGAAKGGGKLGSKLKNVFKAFGRDQ